MRRWLCVLLILGCDDGGGGSAPAEDATTADAVQGACEEGTLSCAGSVLLSCTDGELVTGADCAADGEACEDGVCVPIECTPDCEGKVCGDDGCNGSCGDCADDEACEEGACVAPGPCGDGVCEDPEACDSCPADCGCAEGEGCEAGVCVCTPDCGESVCGDDGCGGSCGDCAEGEDCEAGACVEGCVPDCEGKVCGDDGCEGSCGDCEEGMGCDQGVCVEGCVPDCEGKVCGDDGCEGSCGPCQAGESCEAGACVEGCVPDCEGKVCGDDGCNGSCGPCEGRCMEGQCCEPACDGRNCGDDACGGECGACAPDELCLEEGQCCAPDCQGRACGDDGCGGSCGGCEEDERCSDAGACEDCDCAEGELCLEQICRAPAEVCEGPDRGLCGADELCVDGACEAFEPAPLCDDANPCTADVYDAERDTCTHQPDDRLECDDGDGCTNSVCQRGLCTAVPIADCIEPPFLDPYEEHTPEPVLLLGGERPEGAAVIIDGELAQPPEPGQRFALRLALVPGPNSFEIRTEIGGQRSAARGIHVVYDPTPPVLSLTPSAGHFREPFTVRVSTDEAATVWFTDDGSEPNETSRTFLSTRSFRVFDEVTLRFKARDRAGNDSDPLDARFTVGTARNDWREHAELPTPLAFAGWAVEGDRLFVAGGTQRAQPQASTAVWEEGAWVDLPALPSPRSNLGLTVSGNLLTAVGGLNAGGPIADVSLLDRNQDAEWREAPPLSTARHGLAVAQLGGWIYAFGGRNAEGFNTAVAERWQQGLEAWEPLPDLPTPRFGAMPWVHQGRVYLFGGMDDGDDPVGAVTSYNPGTNAWEPMAPMPTPRAWASLGLVRNAGQVQDGPTRLLVAGGLSSGAPSARVEEYDLDTDTWRNRSPLPEGRAAAPALPSTVEGELDTLDHALLLFGGQLGAGPTDSVLRYRHGLDYAERIAPLPEGRFLHHAVQHRGRIYLFGGRGFAPTRAGWVFDPEAQTYGAMPVLPDSQNRAGAASLDERFYLCGGFNRFGVELRTARVFDPVASEWSDLPNMPQGRGDVAVAAHKGEIWVIGGAIRGEEFEEELSAAVNVYDPLAGFWREEAPLPSPRSGALAVSYGGALYLIGGADAQGNPITGVLRWREGNWEAPGGQAVSAAFAAGVRVGTSGFAIVGGRENGTPVARLQIYDLAQHQLRQSDSRLLPARDRLAVTSHRGRLYIFGGNHTPEVGPEGAAEALRVDLGCLGGAACGGTPVNFARPRVGVPVEDLSHWRTCWSSNYASSADLGTLQSSCQGQYVLYACRPRGAPAWTVAAMGDRGQVFRDTGQGDEPTVNNGVGWYYNGDSSVGFAPEGAALSREPCDTEQDRAELRLCWRTNANQIIEGERCGATMDADAGWERAALVPR